MKDMKDVLEQAAAANELSRLFGEIYDSSIETLKADFPQQAAEETGTDFSPELEKLFYETLDEELRLVGALGEQEAKTPEKEEDWLRFGILLSGIISNQNGHWLDCLDVELHNTQGERAVKKILNREWCLDDGQELLKWVQRMLEGDYAKRFARYSAAESEQDLFEEDMDQEDRFSEGRAWRFARHYRERFAPDFFAGWDAGRGAMLLRWGAYLGWITRKEADDGLIALAKDTAGKLHSWREFGQSYLAGAMLFKLICGEMDGAAYLEEISGSIQELLRGKPEEGVGQWRAFAWPRI